MTARDEDAMKADELEQEIAATRSRVDMTLESIQRKFSAGQLLDEAISFVRSNGAGARWRASVVENPVPALVFGAAAAWFAWSAMRAYDRRETAEQRWARIEQEEEDLVGETVGETYDPAARVPGPVGVLEADPAYPAISERDDPFKA